MPDDQISVTASQFIVPITSNQIPWLPTFQAPLLQGELHVFKKIWLAYRLFSSHADIHTRSKPGFIYGYTNQYRGRCSRCKQTGFRWRLLLGGKPRQVDEQTKLALHAAGVMISNFMSALFLNANDLIQTYVQDDEHNFAIEYYKGIARSTLENIITQGLPDAITGPVARGDLKTVHRHLGILKDPEAITFYKLMTRRLAREFHNDEHAIFRL